MSNPFTNPLSEVPLQDLLDELTLAYSERRQALGQPAYTPSAGRDWQDPDFWSGLQTWVETNCDKFIDHIAGPVDGDQFKYWTLATFRDAAGLPTDGFRRAVDWDGIADPVWLYGLFQTGDVIGPWIIEDLQKAFSTLRWALKSPVSVEIHRWWGQGDLEDRTDAENAAWAEYLAQTKPYERYGGAYFARMVNQVYGGSKWDADIWAVQRRAESFVDSYPDPPVPATSTELYAFIDRFAGGHVEFYTFGNDYVEGWNVLSDGETFDVPATLYGASPQWAPGPTIIQRNIGVQSEAKFRWLVKWQFTNQNEVL